MIACVQLHVHRCVLVIMMDQTSDKATLLKKSARTHTYTYTHKSRPPTDTTVNLSVYQNTQESGGLLGLIFIPGPICTVNSAYPAPVSTAATGTDKVILVENLSFSCMLVLAATVRRNYGALSTQFSASKVINERLKTEPYWPWKQMSFVLFYWNVFYCIGYRHTGHRRTGNTNHRVLS